MKVVVHLVGSCQPLIVEVDVSDLAELNAEMGRRRCLDVTDVVVDGDRVARRALVPVNRVQMIAALDD